MATWIWILIAGVVGAAVGALAMYFVVPRAGLGRDARQLRGEFDAYREEVADHFAATANAVNRLTDSYKDVFEHLQQGADRLVSPEALKEKLADQSQEVITLKRLGARVSVDDQEAPTATPTSADVAAKPPDAESDAEDSSVALSPDDRLRQSES